MDVVRTWAAAGLAAALALLPAADAGAARPAPAGAAGDAAGAARTAGRVPGTYGLAAAGAFARPGTFAAPSAVTYAPELVPPGARVAVGQRVSGGRTTVELRVRGAAPGRAFGAHVHTGACGPDPADAGPHYQDAVDPVRPSTDPAYANPANEVWLDFATDASGDGGAVARQEWTFRPGQARSVVLHEHRTATGPAGAGQAGARLACFTVPFVPRAAGGR
ncbi:superoxide dismutase family protein [Streptomyces sp. TRM 70351]|uniref:superoxide dismutase family protein n=1 Tax=Streptomyces sp. TRM 70351 TaxID=3116552 RepID=UPI002E7B8397|nr:superoxide dismutase family protein [Streptomyces sp. TRM 70351]MEE1928546.1 superoxide dismutase family protein [Streptomyces sp. TRM 70351]